MGCGCGVDAPTQYLVACVACMFPASRCLWIKSQHLFCFLSQLLVFTPADLASNIFPVEGRWLGSVPALKSGLQKGVRLCRGPCATRCALQLLKDDPAELLRRWARGLG